MAGRPANHANICLGIHVDRYRNECDRVFVFEGARACLKASLFVWVLNGALGEMVGEMFHGRNLVRSRVCRLGGVGFRRSKLSAPHPGSRNEAQSVEWTA